MDRNRLFDRGYAARFAEKFHFSDRLLRILRGFAATFYRLSAAAKPHRKIAIASVEAKLHRK